MENSLADRLVSGGLANNSQFFGDSTAEIVSVRGNTNNSAWHGSWAGSLAPTRAWSAPGGSSDNGSGAGVLSAEQHTGIAESNTSHRTILLGY
ncbi:hypothetical protein FWG76_02495 [Candidatus Saccharibacteria bacterium]|nr:hypothetical protein [Candidatus Saccharibacteria bacterium]